MIYDSFLKSLFFRMDPEETHHLAINIGKNINNQFLTKSILSGLFRYTSPRLKQQICNLEFPNPVGLAAGFDKNGKLPMLMQAIGFGFEEVGSITAQPSSGNEKPRLFRLPQDDSLINRMGLNNDGAKTVCRRLAHNQTDIPVGVNIAKTNDPAITGDKAIEDYIFSYREANHVADYITINISCPNTKDGKSFESPDVLSALLDALQLQIDARRVPTFIKMSPDLDFQEIEKIIEVGEDFSIDGYAATNTSSKRTGLQTNTDVINEIGPGGLSGQAIRQRSTKVIRWIRDIAGPNKPIMGIGGINSVESALEKLKAGANLLQIYSGLIYEGPSLPGKINRGIDKFLKKNNIEMLTHLPKALD